MSNSDKNAILAELAERVDEAMQKKATRLLIYRIFLLLCISGVGALSLDIRSLIMSHYALPAVVERQAAKLSAHDDKLNEHSKKLAELHDFQTITSEKLRRP